MEATIRGDGQSTLNVNKTGITIWLPWRVFGEGWGVLRERLLEAIGQRRFVAFTPRVMTERHPDPDAPRWKRTCLDVVSWVLFLLKVPTTHQLVQLWYAIDWRAINQLGASEYHNAHSGRRAWAPAQLIAMLILMFLYGIAYETTLVAGVQENIVWCWFCGFGLFGPFPVHDALYELRNRLGVEKFEALLTMAVHTCQEAGLVSNSMVHFDLTAVVASAHRWSPYERAVILSRALMRYLELVWAEQAPEEPFPDALRRLAAEVALECLPHKGSKDVRPERVVESVEKWERDAEAAESEPVWKVSSDEIVESLLEEEGVPPSLLGPMQASCEKVKEWLKGIAEQVLECMPHARGDPNARVGRTTSYTWFCGYLLGFMVDNARQVITAVVWAAGNFKQSKLFRPGLQAHIERFGKPEAVAADSAFDDYEIHRELDEKGITGHITTRAHAQPRNGGYGTDRVTWVEESTQPLCPSEQPLKAGHRSKNGRQIFEGTACAGCELYERCHPTGQGQPKQFHLNPQAHRRWQENRAHCQTEEYKQAQGKRFAAEGRFGLAKMNHHGAKAPYRSDEMNHIAGLMIATVMNYCILAQHQGGERRST
jgi:transposase